jgi:hypothetical protein
MAIVVEMNMAQQMLLNVKSLQRCIIKQITKKKMKQPYESNEYNKGCTTPNLAKEEDET